MTMEHPRHPDDERLSALAGADPQATGDAALTDHVSACERCRAVVADLRALRMALAELPDLAPSRPLRLLPPVEAARPGFADRLAGVVRRAFAPAMTAGAALALVGVVGTTMPALSQPAGASPAAAEEPRSLAAEPGGAEASGGVAGTPAAAAPEAADSFTGRTATGPSPSPEAAFPQYESSGIDQQADVEAASDVPTQRSPWPMVLFTGVALMVAALTLRWILEPRAA